MNHTLYRSRFITLILLGLTVSCRKQPTATPFVPPSNTPASPAATAVPGDTLPATLPTEVPTTMPQAGTPPVSVPAAALVNGQPIPLQEYETQVNQAIGYLQQQQSFDPTTEEGKAALTQLRAQVLSWMIDQTLIEQAAAREGIVIPEDKVDAEIARLIGDDAAKFDEWLKANNLTRDSFKVQLQRELLGAALQEHVIGPLPAVVEQVHARHVLVMSEAEAMNVLVKLRSGESFADLAKQYSQDKASSEMGGDLGFFPRGVMPLEIEATAFALEPGQVSGIVKTDFGYHIIEVVEKDPSRNVPDEMLASWRQKVFLRWLESQRAAAKIEYLIPAE